MRRTASYLAVAAVSAAVAWVVAELRPVPVAAQAPPPVVVVPPGDDLTPDERIGVGVYRSVVNIATRSLAADDVFGLFAEPRAGTGSGSVLDRAGHILTNNHVIENARRIEVTLADGSAHEGKLVGADPNNDLAVLKIDAPADKLVPLAWGDSNRLLVGVRVYAIGNPFGLERTLTTGIVSSLNRSLRTENNRMIRGIIQTDAAINPGNSGGPLLDKHGAMVGITTAIISRSGSSAGVGLAIPSAVARRVVEELVRHGKVMRPDSGIFSVFETDKGLLVNRLTPDGPAEKAGLQGPQERVIQRGAFTYRVLDRSKADLIVAVDGRRVRTLDDLLSYVESKKPGEKVTLRVVRDGEETDVVLTLAGPG
ncbi:MAG TPA: trypsin-like peptidase domain-containing protein [Gemmataceae bacterium]